MRRALKAMRWIGWIEPHSNQPGQIEEFADITADASPSLLATTSLHTPITTMASGLAVGGGRVRPPAKLFASPSTR